MVVKAKPQPKKAAVADKSDGPLKTSEMVIQAINAIRSSATNKAAGISRHAIKGYLMSHYRLADDATMRSRLNRSLKAQVKNGSLTALKGSFKLPSKEKAGKEKAGKKVVKKTIQKKDKAKADTKPKATKKAARSK